MTGYHAYRHIGFQPPISAAHDGQGVLLLGRYVRHRLGATLTDRNAQIELIGEPFDWAPPHGAALEVWGQLWLGQSPRLLVHNARRLGDLTRQPSVTPTKPVGTTFHMIARVVTLARSQLALTEDHHTYLLGGTPLDAGLYALTGQITSLHPPMFLPATSQPLRR
jgi:hypothetical protein